MRGANLTDDTRCRKTDARRGWRNKMRLLAADIELPLRADGESYRSRPTRIFDNLKFQHGHCVFMKFKILSVRFCRLARA